MRGLECIQPACFSAQPSGSAAEKQAEASLELVIECFLIARENTTRMRRLADSAEPLLNHLFFPVSGSRKPRSSPPGIGVIRHRREGAGPSSDGLIT